MAVYKQKSSKNWHYKFTWHGELIRRSTKQTNKRVAEQMEAAHKTSLAKGEVGIRERKLIPTLADFAKKDFLPFVQSAFAEKVKTRKYYEYGAASLLSFEALADEHRFNHDRDYLEVRGAPAKARPGGLQHQPRTSGASPHVLAGTGMGQGREGASKGEDATRRAPPGTSAQFR